MPNKSKPESLEIYMAQIADELRDLPSQARDEELREIEAHLRAMIETRGDVAGVLAQFGQPRKVGRDLRKSWERKQPEAWWRAVLAPVFGLAFSVYFIEPFEQGFYDFYSPSDMASITIVSFFLISITTYMMGLISPKRTMLILGSFLILMFSPNILDGSLFSSLWTFISFVSFAISAIIGSHFGALHSRKIFVRIVK